MSVEVAVVETHQDPIVKKSPSDSLDMHAVLVLPRRGGKGGVVAERESLACLFNIA